MLRKVEIPTLFKLVFSCWKVETEENNAQRGWECAIVKF